MQRAAPRSRAGTRPIAARRCADVLTALLLAACAGAPATVPDPEAVITAAEERLQQNDPAGALELLESLEPGELAFRLAERHQFALAFAEFNSGEVWDAFEVAEKFPDRFPHSERRMQIGELVWRIGDTLHQSNRSFLFFYSEADGARSALQHLITRHPDNPRVPDALRVLGDMAFDDQDYLLAQERYRDLMRRFPDSEWGKSYAPFRFAMSMVEGLQGPEYDLDQMELASRELTQFLAAGRENPRFVDEARAALARVLAWRAERHYYIAEFYRRVDNPAGQRLHLGYASAAEFAGTEAHARAVRDLAALTDAKAADEATATGSPTPEPGTEAAKEDGP